MITFPPLKSSYGKSYRYGKSICQSCIDTILTIQKAWTSALNTKLKPAIQSSVNGLCDGIAHLALKFAAAIVATIRKPPVHLPGITTRSFYLFQWQDDANSLQSGLPRLIYSIARIPDAVGIALTCCRAKPAVNCTRCNNDNCSGD